MKTIGIICPYKYNFDLWVSEYGQFGEQYTMIRSIDDIQGRKFSSVIPGPFHYLVDGDVYEQALLRVEP